MVIRLIKERKTKTKEFEAIVSFWGRSKVENIWRLYLLEVKEAHATHGTFHEKCDLCIQEKNKYDSNLDQVHSRGNSVDRATPPTDTE